MRVTLPMKHDRMVNDLNRKNTRLEELAAQISSGKRILRPSDDPLSWVKAMSIKKGLQELDTLQSNVNYAVHWNRAAENTLDQLSDLFVSAKEVAIGAMGAPSKDGDYARMQELDQIFHQALSLANTRHENRFLFAVNRSDPPFALDPQDGTLLQGPGNPMELDDSFSVRTGHGLSQEVGLDARSLFYLGEGPEPLNVFRGDDMVEAAESGEIHNFQVNGVPVSFVDATDPPTPQSTAAAIADAVNASDELKAAGIRASVGGAGNNELSFICTRGGEVVLSQGAEDAGMGSAWPLAGLGFTMTDAHVSTRVPERVGEVPNVVVGEAVPDVFDNSDTASIIVNGHEVSFNGVNGEKVGSVVEAAILGDGTLQSAGITASWDDDTNQMTITAADGRGVHIEEISEGGIVVVPEITAPPTTLSRASTSTNELTGAIPVPAPIPSGSIQINGHHVHFTGGDDVVSTTLGFVDAVNNDATLKAEGITASTVVDPSSPHHLKVTLTAADGGAIELATGTTEPGALGFTGATDKPSIFEPGSLQVLLDLKEAIARKDPGEITKQMENVEKVLENLGRQTSLVGNRLAALDTQKSALESISLEEQVRLSEVEDVDMLSAISQLQAKSTTFEAALKVTGMLQGLNLTQYI